MPWTLSDCMSTSPLVFTWLDPEARMKLPPSWDELSPLLIAMSPTLLAASPVRSAVPPSFFVNPEYPLKS